MTRVRLQRHKPTVAVLAYEGMSAFELGIVNEVFGLPRPEFDLDWYDLAVCTEQPYPVRIIGGATLSSEHNLEAFDTASTVIVPGVSDVHADSSPELMNALQRSHERGARIVSICSGAFALAQAGLLRNDFGPSIANAVARRLVIPPHRDGGQAQFIELPMSEPSDDRITATMTWALANLAEPITVEILAQRAHLSSRSFLRRFKQSTGTSPIRWLINQRIQSSLPLLEKAGLSIDEIAGAVGFDTAVTFRHHFARALQTSPSAYRRAFRDSLVS